MREEILIHKINITDEAKFDIKECLEIQGFNWRELKAEVEEYITHQTRENRIPWWGYFRCKYYDEKSDAMLMLFFYKAERLSIMQFWNLAGVCLAEDWTEEAEDSGQIRNWLKCKITDLDKGDWVVEQQLRAETDKIIMGYAVQGSINGLPKEIKDAVEYGNNQELTKALSLLQNTSGKWAGRNAIKRQAEVYRKLDKHIK